MNRFIMAILLAGAAARAAELVVAPAGGDFTTVQAALNAAGPGDTVSVRAGVYHETVSFPASGSATGGWITLRSYPGETGILDGTGLAGQNLVLLNNRSFIRIEGLELRNLTNITDGSGIRLLGACQHVAIVSNHIHDLAKSNAMGITVYGTSATPASNLVIRYNHIHHCAAAQSEALVLNGNVTDFDVSYNTVHDINNIGIDFIGGETDIHPSGVARRGTCRGNRIYRCRSNYGGGYAAGLYVDGGRDLVLEHNVVSECDLGIEIGAENAGFNATGIVVRSNWVVHNDKVGIVFGGYAANVGRVTGCRFENNTCYGNDTLNDGNGELWVQFSSSNIVQNNIFASGPENVLLTSVSASGNVGNRLDYNLWHTPGGNPADVSISWRGAGYSSFAAYRAAAGQDANSVFTNPLFAAAASTNLHLLAASPAINRGNPSNAYSTTLRDIDGESRVMGGRIDLGADEVSGYTAWRDEAFAGVADFATNSAAPRYGPSGDYDGDGASNLLEFLGGTDALSTGSFHRISAIGPEELRFAVLTNRAYTVEGTTHLHGATAWAAEGPPFAAASNDAAHAWPIAAADARLYRVAIEE